MKLITCPLRKNAVTIGTHPAVIFGNKLLTYRQLDSAVEASVAKFLSIGVKKGDRICVVSPVNIEYLVVMCALWRIGAITCLLSERQPEIVINEQCKKVRAKFIVSGYSGMLHSPYIKTRKIDLFSVAKWQIKKLSACSKERIVYQENQAATVIFSSGSSGKPKAVQQSIGSHYYNAKGSNENITVSSSDRWLLLLPLYHVSGLSIIFRCFLGGGAIVIPEKNSGSAVVIEKCKVTHISLVAAQLYRLLSDKKALGALKKLKAILLGGSAIPESLLEEAVTLGLPVYASYGLTEMSSQVATTGLLKGKRLSLKPKILRFRKINIAKDGEILLSGKTLFQGYVHNGRLQRAVDPEGWFHSQDIGCITQGRYLFVRGRKDTMFISGGENIQPEEIERLLCTHEFIKQAVVVPSYNEEYGFRPVAFLKLKKHNRFNRTVLLKYLKQYLPKFKIPDEFYTWPKTGVSERLKLQRKDFMRIVAKGKPSPYHSSGTWNSKR
jgi:O-succinylbenzoic acid--CoA ligase